MLKINEKVCPLSNHVNSMKEKKGKLMSIENWVDKKFYEKLFLFWKIFKLSYGKRNFSD